MVSNEVKVDSRSIGDLIRHDMIQFQLVEDMTSDKRLWRTPSRIPHQQVVESCLTYSSILVNIILFGQLLVLRFLLLTVFLVLQFLLLSVDSGTSIIVLLYNNNIPRELLQVGFGEDKMYVDLTSTSQKQRGGFRKTVNSNIQPQKQKILDTE